MKKTKKQPQHVQLSGMAVFLENKNFMFSPHQSTPGTLKRFRRHGLAQLLTDGTFDFVTRPKYRPQSTLIKKLAHGRLSATKDGAILLTLKVFKYEGLDARSVILKEAEEAFV